MATNTLFQEYPAREFGPNDVFDYHLGDLSLSPEDCDLIARMNGFDTDPASEFSSEPWFSDFVNYDAPDGLLPGALGNLGAFPDAGPMGNVGMVPNGGFFDPSFDCNTNNGQFQDMVLYDQPYDLTTTIRQAVEAQAAVNTSCSSQKEKRMEASIAFHMQRLQESPLTDPYTSPEFSSPSSSYMGQGSASPTSTGASQTPASATTDGVSTPTLSGPDQPGGVELVLDLNMNATTNLPKKHKPRSQAQRDNYIKVRKHGACEKHKKQHKRCNCLEKKASLVDVHDGTIIQPPKHATLQSFAPRSTQSSLPSRSTPRDTAHDTLLDLAHNPTHIPRPPRPSIQPISRNDTDIQPHSSTPRCPRSEILWSLYRRHDRPSLDYAAQHSVSVNDKRAKLPTGPQIQLASNSRVVNTDTQQLGKNEISRRLQSRSTLQNHDTAQSTCHTYTKGSRIEHIHQRQSHEKIQSTGTRAGMLPVRPPATANAPGTTPFANNAQNHTLPKYAGRLQRTLVSDKAPSIITSGTLPSGSNGKNRTPECAGRKVQRTLESTRSFWQAPAITTLPGSNGKIRTAREDVGKRTVVSMHSQAPATTSGKILPGSNAQSTLPEYAGRVIQRMLGSVFSLWQAPSALTSLVGSYFGKAIIGCLKQYWSARKSLGICGSSRIV
ncbi:uncharacterized protein ACHE_40512S [Aspergillus chevalieri]|uniref:Uncharacterized protein n=1 Tax=Aspergillus chevalieri TaxID=182096 RepID=A0A7R7ZMW7_ASPCH|nr:uncharacterized protein ACHE_40512S [Aspergillus chevalieri]BCR87948.1 hypothetical protein ACHE_40512S [Aspergillus chevalieri]